MVGSLNRPQSRVGDFYREMGEVFGNLPFRRPIVTEALRFCAKMGGALAPLYGVPSLSLDEAQEMKLDVLSELRLLASTNFDSHSVLTVVRAATDN